MQIIETPMTETELEEYKTQRSLRRYRMLATAGRYTRKATKWSLITLGAITAVGIATSCVKSEETEDES